MLEQVEQKAKIGLVCLEECICDGRRKNNFKIKIIHETTGEEAGIKSSTLLIEGRYAFGYLKKESGVHRLVRISPFDSNSRRHTSFSSVWITPHVDDNINIEIQEKD
jgi:peptide chain release factor 2